MDFIVLIRKRPEVTWLEECKDR